MIKVVVLNSMYNTWIENDQLIPMAEKIIKVSELDDWIYSAKDNSKDWDKAFKAIASSEGVNKMHPSFASKYCSWHNPEKFPISDSIARSTLCLICEEVGIGGEEKLNPDSLAGIEKYSEFCELHENLRNRLEEENIKLSVKKLDEFLWRYGKDLEEEKKAKGGAAK